jgi:hypothetical protein
MTVWFRENPTPITSSLVEMNRLAREKFASLSDEDRAMYEQKAKDRSAKLLEMRQYYDENMTGELFLLKHVRRFQRAFKSVGMVSKVEKLKKTVRRRDAHSMEELKMELEVAHRNKGSVRRNPGKPNRYINYISQMRSQYAEENPDIPSRQVFAELAKQWSRLSAEEKDQYKS